MSIAVDASSPARVSGVIASGASITTDAFTAPAGSFLVAAVAALQPDAAKAVFTLSDSGGLTWTNRVEHDNTEVFTGGHAGFWTAPVPASASRTVTLTWTSGGGAGSIRHSLKVYVVTGGNTVDTIGVDNEGGSASDPWASNSLTPAGNGLLFAVDMDWQRISAVNTCDLTYDTATYAGEFIVVDGYKAAVSGVGVAANIDWTLTTPDPRQKWCTMIVLETVVPAPSVFAQRRAWRRTTSMGDAR